jgi:hypothetical protein
MVQNVLLADTERRYFPTQFNVTGNVHQYVYMFHGYYRELAAGNGFVTSRRADITSQVKKKKLYGNFRRQNYNAPHVIMKLASKITGIQSNKMADEKRTNKGKVEV